MLLAAAVDAGADLGEVEAALDGLGLEGWALRADPVTRGGIAATTVVVLVADTDSGVVRTWGNVRALLEDAKLPERVKVRSLATFSRIAEVSARLSRRPVDHVHFSEIAALDAIIDVVGTCAAFALLDIGSLTCGPVAQGVGMVRGEHGLHPVPSPEVLALLEGAVTYGTGEPMELCTTTGAALLAEWADGWGPMPPLRIERVGYGAGLRDLDRPNLVRMVLGEPIEPVAGAATLLALSARAAPAAEGDRHGAPAGWEDGVARLRSEGALDAWALPLAGGGTLVTCLALPQQADTLRAALVTATGAASVHGSRVERWVAGTTAPPVEVPAAPRPEPLPPIPPDPRSA